MSNTTNKPQHWDWGQTEITSPMFTLRSVTTINGVQPVTCYFFFF